MTKFNVGDVVNITTEKDGTIVGVSGMVTDASNSFITIALPTYNGKVVCVDNSAHPHRYTVGKVYTFVNGYMQNNYDVQPKTRPITSFDDWTAFSDDKWVELVED